MHIVDISINGSVGTVTMNRPEKRNALSTELVAALSESFAALNANPVVKVIVLRGAGSAFCAGADLAYLQQISKNSVLENVADSERLKNLFQQIVTMPKPVIAMVHGAAIAGGCGLASVCDIVIAAKEKALFGYSEVKIGFIPAIVMVYLQKKIGDTQTRRLVLTAENISADEALRLGLISYVVDDNNLEEYTMELATRMSANSSSAMAMSKQMMAALHGMSLEDGLTYATAMNALARQTDDCKQGIERFLTKEK